MSYYDQFALYGQQTPGVGGVGLRMPATQPGYAGALESYIAGLPPGGVTTNVSTAGVGPASDLYSKDWWLGTRDRPGVASAGLGLAGGAMGLFLGLKQYGLAKDTMAENKRQFNLNWGAQSKLINSQLEDRQRARVSADPRAYESVESYMARNRI